jgi:hypothetical protein
MYSFEVKVQIVLIEVEFGALIYAGKRISIHPDLSAEQLK